MKKVARPKLCHFMKLVEINRNNPELTLSLKKAGSRKCACFCTVREHYFNLTTAF